MKIMHIGLLSHFTEHMTYQENLLTTFNLEDSNEVIFISDIYQYREGKLVEDIESDVRLENGMRLIRLKYDNIINKAISNKIQRVKRLSEFLEEIMPDSILFHGCCGFELMTVAKYVRKNPNVLFFVDSHEDFHNTARTPLAKFFYKWIHGYFIKRSLDNIEKILYLSYESRDYLKEMYKFPESVLEYYPLGGVLMSEKECIEIRNKFILKYNLSSASIIISHTGKLVSAKKTKELLKAFTLQKNPFLSLFIAGRIEDHKDYIMKLIEDDHRIHYLGWIKSNQLLELLSATDLYCQPGTQSATLQNALCANCAVMVYPYSSHLKLLGDSAFYTKDQDEIQEFFSALTPQSLQSHRKKCFQVATDILDYKLLARRITVRG